MNFIMIIFCFIVDLGSKVKFNEFMDIRVDFLLIYYLSTL